MIFKSEPVASSPFSPPLCTDPAYGRCLFIHTFLHRPLWIFSWSDTSPFRASLLPFFLSLTRLISFSFLSLPLGLRGHSLLLCSGIDAHLSPPALLFPLLSVRSLWTEKTSESLCFHRFFLSSLSPLSLSSPLSTSILAPKTRTLPLLRKTRTLPLPHPHTGSLPSLLTEAEGPDDGHEGRDEGARALLAPQQRQREARQELNQPRKVVQQLGGEGWG